jgi:hypothetical protein
MSGEGSASKEVTRWKNKRRRVGSGGYEPPSPARQATRVDRQRGVVVATGVVCGLGKPNRRNRRYALYTPSQPMSLTRSPGQFLGPSVGPAWALAARLSQPINF